jgi:hypothetical protein
MLRFVIQEHHKRKTKHYDLMVETLGALKTWSFAEPLGQYALKPTVQKAELLPDHRFKYLSYEGKISRGRGWVRIWDNGEYRKIIGEKNCYALLVKGQKIKGYLVILSHPHRLLLLLALIHFR